MSQSNSRGFRGKNAFSFDRGNADMPDNCGNRKTFEEMKIPLDNMGNKIEQNPISSFTHDNLGNSVDEEPAHLRSGILSHLTEERVYFKRPKYEPSYTKTVPEFKRNKTLAKVVFKEPVSNPIKKNPVKTSESFEDCLLGLIDDFSKALDEKSGLPFSFSMKPIHDRFFDESAEYESLLALKTTIEQILVATKIEAMVRISRYQTENHRFAVFFINPTERDPVRNKEFISAMRQTIKLYLLSFPIDPVNVLLVLANAEKVIEDHLFKIGARKFS